MRYYRNYRISKYRRLIFACLFSLALHAALLMFVRFVQPAWKNSASESVPMNVMLELKHAEVAKPVTAAEDTVEKLVSSELLPGEQHEKIIPAKPSQKKSIIEKLVTEKTGPGKPARQAGKIKLLKDDKSSIATAEKIAEPQASPAEGGKPGVVQADVPGVETFSRNVLDIPRIMKIAREDDRSNSSGARIKTIDFKEQDLRYVMYMERLRLKLERIGSLNYPAAGKNLSGTLHVKISIRPDGSLEDFSIIRPARHEELNAGAEKIVRMSAPFAPLPENIRREADILSITIRWTFSKSRQQFD